MRRIEAGEMINLSDNSQYQDTAATEKERTTEHYVLFSQNQNMSDCESECLEPLSKRITLDSTSDTGESSNSNAASFAALVCFYCFFSNSSGIFPFKFVCVSNTTMEQLLRCMLLVEEIELSRSSHNNCESRWRKNVKVFASIFSLLSITFSSALAASSSKRLTLLVFLSIILSQFLVTGIGLRKL